MKYQNFANCSLKMSQLEQPYLFFINSPNFNNLLNICVECTFNEDGRRNLSFFHQRVMKCRELIFSTPELVACPVNFSRTEIFMVMQKNRFCSPEFQKKLDKMRLRVIKVDIASPVFLQECLQYTTVAKLAPQWNSVGNLLVQGRDFLEVSSLLNAIKLDIFVNGLEITLCVTPKCVKLPPLKVETYRKLYEISENPISIQETCHVLPSLKKGNAVTLSRSIPRKGVFLNYADMKKHWKNMYGYRLPETSEEGIWFVNVEFNIPFSPTYTYPIFCVRPSGMLEVPRMATESTIQSFMFDFFKKVTNFCGERCKILDSKAAFPTLQIYPAQAASKETLPKIGTSYTVVQNKNNKVNIKTEDKVNIKTEDKVNIKMEDKVNIKVEDKGNIKTEDIPVSSSTDAKDSLRSSFVNKSQNTIIGKNEKDCSVNSNKIPVKTNFMCLSNLTKDFNSNTTNAKNGISEGDKYEVKATSNCHSLQTHTEDSQKNVPQTKYVPTFTPRKAVINAQNINCHSLQLSTHTEDCQKKVSQTKYVPTFTPRKAIINAQNIKQFGRNKLSTGHPNSSLKEKSSFGQSHGTFIQKPKSSYPSSKIPKSSSITNKKDTSKTAVALQKVDNKPKICSINKEKKISKKTENKKYSESGEVKKIKSKKTPRKV